jgi:hypothetical protein
MSTLDTLEREVRVQFPDLESSRENIGGAERVRLVRKGGDGSFRYLLIALVNDPEGELPPETFSIIGGSQNNPDPDANFDGRQWGNLSHTLTVIKQWLIDLVATWSELPRHSS